MHPLDILWSRLLLVKFKEKTNHSGIGKGFLFCLHKVES